MEEITKPSWTAAVAEWIWGSSDHENTGTSSADFCAKSFPIMNGACWTQLVSKLLGVVIILGSCLNQIPVMMNLYKSKSASGLSKTFLYGDILIKVNAAAYGYLTNMPMTAYGENIALSIQSVGVLLLAWHFSNVTVDEKVTALVGATTYFVLVTKLLPDNYRYILLASIWPIMVYSRGAQILETQKVKHTGAQSIITTGSNLLGSLARIGTTIVEVGFDIPMLTGLLLSAGLNTLATIQYFAYKKNTDKLYSSSMQEKKAA
ncbi:hypothetical protein MPSEU_000206600 [Mayamaea pseudoterrestris]|nr:hypothetical protein MPSEU_000206600 [Mayamaea pseudoterrestris]